MLSFGLVTDAVTDACGEMLTMLSSCGRLAALMNAYSGKEAGNSSSSSSFTTN
jgi:head-tail adaptor